MKRRTFIRSSSLATLSLAGLGIYAWQIEPFWLEFVKKSIRVPNLPEELKGTTLMQISDIHIGERFSLDFILNSLQAAADFNPDFVIYTGDYITYESDRQLSDLKHLSKYFVKGKLGTVGILGNHDYGKNWSDSFLADNVTDELTNAGIRVLRNEQQSINGLNFIGLDDYWGRNFNPQLVMGNVDNNAPNILLSHNPDTVDLDIWNGYRGWIFSGHTHGGQCKPPFLKPPMLPVENKKYTSGVFNLDNDRKLYVNRALGHLWQVRFNVRPEITIFSLS